MISCSREKLFHWTRDIKTYGRIYSCVAWRSILQKITADECFPRSNVFKGNSEDLV